MRPVNRVGKDFDVGDAVFEQIPAAGRVRVDQRQRVVGVEVLREHDDPHYRVALSDGAGGGDSFVGEGGWHSNVDQRHVWLGTVDRFEQRVSIAYGGRDLDAVSRQQRP